MLRLNIDEHPSLHDKNVMGELASSLRRAKWMDDEVIELGLSRVAQDGSKFGLEKAEIIHAMATVLHGQLAKKNPQAFASVNTTIDLIFESPHFIAITDEIVELFLSRFTPERLEAQGHRG